MIQGLAMLDFTFTDQNSVVWLRKESREKIVEYVINMGKKERYIKVFMSLCHVLC